MIELFDNIYDFGLKILTVTKLSWNGACYRVQPRANAALVYRVKGNAHFKFNDGTEIATKEGEVFYCPPNIGYDVEYDDGEIIVFHFIADNLPSGPKTKALSYQNRVKDMFQNAVQVWEEHKTGYIYKVLSLFFDILSLCFTHKLSDNSFKKEYIIASDYVRENYLLSELSISTICSKFRISETGFRKYFSSVYGGSPVKYINEMRIREAERMLLGTDMKVEEIAYKCGFNDVKYFSRVFSKYRGCPPSEFRKY